MPVGYKVSAVQFSDGSPIENSTSLTAAVDIISNVDLTACPSGCFRPVGLAFDAQGRLFFSSDATGEIYIITQSAEAQGSSGGNGSVQNATPTSSGTNGTLASSGTGAPSASSTTVTTGSSGAGSLVFQVVGSGSVALLWAVAMGVALVCL